MSVEGNDELYVTDISIEKWHSQCGKESDGKARMQRGKAK